MNVVTDIFFISVHAMSQSVDSNKKSKHDFGFEGMIGASVGNNFFTLNIGGPFLRLRISEDLRVGIGGIPSF